MLLACLDVRVEDSHNAQIASVVVKEGIHGEHYKVVAKSLEFAAVDDTCIDLLWYKA